MTSAEPVTSADAPRGDAFEQDLRDKGIIGEDANGHGRQADLARFPMIDPEPAHPAVPTGPVALDDPALIQVVANRLALGKTPPGLNQATGILRAIREHLASAIPVAASPSVEPGNADALAARALHAAALCLPWKDVPDAYRWMRIAFDALDGGCTMPGCCPFCDHTEPSASPPAPEPVDALTVVAYAPPEQVWTGFGWVSVKKANEPIYQERMGLDGEWHEWEPLVTKASAAAAIAAARSAGTPTREETP